jgi:iron complex transport system permease protein
MELAMDRQSTASGPFRALVSKEATPRAGSGAKVTPLRRWLLLGGLIALPLVVAFVSLFVGRYGIGPWDLLKILVGQVLPLDQTWSDTAERVVFQIRVPRVVLAAFIGAGLAVSGASFQGVFKNPLVSPDILGVTSGAGFGASLAILLSASDVLIQTMALGFGLVSVLLTYLLSRVYRTTPTLMLVLSGMVIGSIMTALMSLIKFIADPNLKLPAITFWLMGSLGSTTMREVFTAVPIMLVGIVGLLLIRWRINVLALGDEEARSLGVKTEVFKAVVIVCATLVCAAAVSVSGIVGWVGLVIPHVGRMIVGPDHRRLIPVCLVLGAAYMMFIDDVARSAIAAEIPLGVLTAIIGAPFFAYLLRRTKGAWR